MSTEHGPKLELLIGMIASGKSTYARSRAREGALVISHDDLTEMLHGEYRYEPGLRECYRTMEEGIAKTAILHGRDVVIDRTHLTRESRSRWVNFVRLFGKSRWNVQPPSPIKLVAIVFPITAPEEHAAWRFAHDHRGRSYEECLGVARHHHAQAMAEPIDVAEGFTSIEHRDWKGVAVVHD